MQTFTQLDLDPRLDQLYELALAAASGKDRDMEQSAFAERAQAVDREDGARARADLLRQTLSRLVSENQAGIDGLNYPQNVRELVRAEFQRIKGSIWERDDDGFDLAKRSIRNDFRMACFSRIPMGVEHIEFGRIPRSLCVRGGLAQAGRFLRMLGQTGGVRPVYEDHIADEIADSPMRFFRAYTAEARAKVYRNVAASLEMNPQYRGLLASSWWFDPKLAQISPTLTKLGRVMLQNGAMPFRYGTDSFALENALANSPARQKLYEQGKYVPTTYYVVWPRDALIAWARDGGRSR